jgi:hypothetical protein
MIVGCDLFLMLTVSPADQLAISREHTREFCLGRKEPQGIKGRPLLPFGIPSTLFWCEESLLLQ